VAVRYEAFLSLREIVRPRIDLQRRLPATTLFDSYYGAGPLLPTLFASSVVGVAVLDGQMRFRAINGALAAMNGMPAGRHVGRKLRHVLGGASPKVEAATDQVLRMGKPVSLDLTAELPSRAGLGHWMESFFPIRDAKGRVTQVAAVVLEITEKKNWERSLNHVIDNLGHIRATLKNQLQFLGGTAGSSHEHSILLTQAVELAGQCIAEAQALCKRTLLDPSINAPHLQHHGVMELEPRVRGSASDVAKGGRLEAGDARGLSPRERAVLELLADGKNNKEVGVALGISMRTAEVYRARMMKKMEIHSLAHLVRFAVRNKIIEA
jgi:PAS domain S-box-containing protein